MCTHTRARPHTHTTTHTRERAHARTGSFIRDRKEGMGTLYMMTRQKKYAAEYVNDHPKCGTYLALDDDEIAPLKGQLRSIALQKKLDLTATGTHHSAARKCTCVNVCVHVHA